jgi:phosphatidylglycerol---prolipoprotein diacylglyceryl transferase
MSGGTVPLLLITIPWDPIVATLGGLVLAWHGVFTAIGILAGVQISLYVGKKIHYSEDDAYSIALVGVPAGVIGARLLYVAEHWSFFSAAPLEVFAINEGGISVWGAVIGGVLGGLLFAAWRRYDIRGGLDIAAFGLVLGLSLGRIGDLINGEHLAKATSLPWGVVYTDPDSPAFAHSIAAGPHHPATTYEMLGAFLLLALMFPILQRFKDRPALTFVVFLDVYSALRFVVSFLRVDSTGAAFGLDMPQFISVVVVLCSLPFAWWFWAHPRPVEEAAPPSPPGTARVRVAAAPRNPRGRRGGDL